MKYGFAFLFCLALAILFFAWRWHIAPWEELSQHKQNVREVFRKVEKTPPNGIRADRWANAVGACASFYEVVAFRPEHLPANQQRALETDLKQLFQDPPSIEMLDRVWDRLEATNERAKQIGLDKRQVLEEWKEIIKLDAKRLKAEED